MTLNSCCNFEKEEYSYFFKCYFVGSSFRIISDSLFFVHRVFILILFSLAMKKLFILMRSHLFILSFMSLALGDISVKILLHGISEIFLLIFSSRNFMVSWLIFKSFIHLEFIFVYGVSWWLSLFFARSCPDLPTPFDEEAIFTPFYASSPFV